jgi:hypothetical protein
VESTCTDFRAGWIVVRVSRTFRATISNSVETKGQIDMLDLMHQLAIRLAPARTALAGLASAGAIVAGTALLAFEPSKGDLVLFPALVVVLWAVLGVVFIEVFTTVPRPPEEGPKPWRRLVQKLSRSFYWALATGFLLMGIVAADVSFSIAREWLDDRPNGVWGNG